MAAGIITLLTDFGTADAFVGIMKGVILGVCPQVRFVDLSHAIPAQQILPAALLLRSAVRFFPAGTVHLAVVDPGVGRARRPIVIETARGCLVGPDNGVLSMAAVALGGGQAWLIENQEFLLQPVSQTFHGRDIFAPVAAHLACGVDPQALGPRIDSIVELAVPAPQRTAAQIAGEVISVDHFGNLITNIDASALATFPDRGVSVSIGTKRVAGPVAAYADVAAGTALAIVGSWGMLEIAVRNGNAAKTLAAGPGTPVTVVVESRDA